MDCQNKNTVKPCVTLKLVIILITVGFIATTRASNSNHPYLQAIHVLDPSIQEFKYHSSWNSDQWIQWVRNRYVEDHEGRRVTKGDHTSSTELVSSDPRPLYGQWVNIIVIASEDEIHSAFSPTSNHSYTNADKDEYRWSDTSFTVFVVVRKLNNNKSGESQDEQSPHFNVFNCSNKKMYINAKVDLTGSTTVLSIQHLFPKKVKNPKDTLRIPLVACTKVGQRRGLLDEIKFQLKH